jgi:hypothetical protein
MIRVVLPPRSPNLKADPERWVRSGKEECLERLMLFGEESLRHTLTQYVEHFHHARPYQGKGNVLLFPLSSPAERPYRPDSVSRTMRRAPEILDLRGRMRGGISSSKCNQTMVMPRSTMMACPEQTTIRRTRSHVTHLD